MSIVLMTASSGYCWASPMIVHILARWSNDSWDKAADHPVGQYRYCVSVLVGHFVRIIWLWPRILAPLALLMAVGDVGVGKPIEQGVVLVKARALEMPHSSCFLNKTSKTSKKIKIMRVEGCQMDTFDHNFVYVGKWVRWPVGWCADVAQLTK